MKITLNQKILIGFITCTVILAVVAIFSFRNSEKIIDSNERVTHTQEVLTELSLLRALSVDGETSVRGFVITDNEDFLKLYSQARQDINEQLAKIKSLTADNPIQQENINQLQKQIGLRVNIMATLIELRHQSFEKAREEASTDEDKQDANEFIKTYCQNKNNR